MERYINDVIKDINTVLYNINAGQIEQIELLVALEHDMGARGSVPPGLPLPTKEEIDELTVSPAMDGDAARRFPRTITLIRALMKRL